jgi:hypothetical protein
MNVRAGRTGAALLAGARVALASAGASGASLGPHAPSLSWYVQILSAKTHKVVGGWKYCLVRSS